jgi:hypothetical protein
MSALVASVAVAHVPGHTVNPAMVPVAQRQRIEAAWSKLKDHLQAVQPDVVVAISNDHFLNFFPVQPAFCVGTGDRHTMPSEQRAAPLKLDSRAVRGAPGFATHLLKVADDAGFPLAFSDQLHFSDEISIPQRFLDPDNTFGWAPILTNCLNRNRPSPRNFLKLGEIIHQAISLFEDADKIAVVATGGLSHDPFGPNWCLIDEAFDRRFLHLIETGATQTLLEEYTLDAILGPGKGGTPEILNWFVGLGAAGAGRPAQIYAYEPVAVWATGVGYASWSLEG